MMKKALFALTATVALVGCNNTAPLVADTNVVVPPATHLYGGAHTKQEVMDTPIRYACENNANVVATYNSATETVDTVLNVPSLSLNNAPVTLKQVAAGSGTRYENTTNPATGYEWHTKAHDAVLSVTVGGSEYNFICQVEKSKTYTM